jgi:hypothetical protein
MCTSVKRTIGRSLLVSSHYHCRHNDRVEDVCNRYNVFIVVVKVERCKRACQSFRNVKYKKAKIRASMSIIQDIVPFALLCSTHIGPLPSHQHKVSDANLETFASKLLTSLLRIARKLHLSLAVILVTQIKDLGLTASAVAKSLPTTHILS